MKNKTPYKKKMSPARKNSSKKAPHIDQKNDFFIGGRASTPTLAPPSLPAGANVIK